MKKQCKFQLGSHTGICKRVKSVPNSPTSAGSIHYPDVSGSPLLMYVMDSYDQNELLSVVMHELVEASLYLQGLTYQPINGNNRGDNIAMLNHLDLTTMSNSVFNAYEQIRKNIS